MMRGVFLLLLLVMLPTFAQAQNAVTAGELTLPYPTITNLSIEWKIGGDDNLNSQVRVYFRAVGETNWREAMLLRRIRADNSGQRTRPTFAWDNKHAGSIFDLRPATEYEISLQLNDPDGGAMEKIVRAKTRGVPKPAANARSKEANPRTFRDLATSAEPGDILQLTPGYYENFVMTRDGTEAKPIVIRGDLTNSIRSVFDSVSLRERKHVILEQVTVNGTVDLLGAEAVAVRHCTINAKFGIIADRAPGCRNCYIADNVVTYVMPWIADGMGSGSRWGGAANVGEGIQLTGPGNVICYNRVRGYRDCISLMEDIYVADQISIDIYNNDLSIGADDGIEADFCQGNCRVLRNRLTNCFMGLSSQPSLGGPTYFIRNVMYNVIEAPFKLERHSVGNVFLHNTVVKVGDGFRVPHGPGEYSFTLFRNNLCIGGLGGGTYGKYPNGTGRALYTPETDATNDFDYDAIGTFGTPFGGKLGNVVFTNLAELRQRTTEKHAVQVAMNVFANVVFPHPPIPARNVPDLRPRAGTAVVNAGVRLPNINDNFQGTAPDIGAYEVGQALPHYGPRPLGIDEETARVKDRKQ